MDTTVRRATAADAAELAELEEEARRAAVDLRGGSRLLADHSPVAGEWARWLGGATHAAWIARIDSLAVGYLALQLPSQRGGVGLVTQVFVTPGARELGLGEQLVEAALDALVEAGAGTLDALALPGDRLTKNLFERAGVVSRLIVLSRPLVR